MVHRLHFFDCNCMIGKSWILEPQPMRLKTQLQLVEEMEYYGIAEAMIYSCMAKERLELSAWQPLSPDEALEWAADQPRLHAMAVLILQHMASNPVPETDVKQMISRGIRMAVVFPTRAFPYLINDWLCGGLLKALEDHRVPMLLQNSDLASRYPQFERTQGFSVENIDWMCEHYPKLPIILAGIAGGVRIVIPLMKRRPNLYIELSKCYIHQPVRYLKEQVGIERILFGSGMPMTSPAPAMTEVHYAPIPEAEKRLVAGDNLRRLLAEVR